jgi:integrase
LFNDVSMIFNAAVDDKKILSNPFAVRTVRRPKYEPTKVVPWSNDQRAKFRETIRDRYRITVDLGVGCGLRQGEIFAVGPDDVDSERGLLHVARQIKIVRNKPIFAPPKGAKIRDVPLPRSVAHRLGEHAKRFPPIPITLPWGSSTGEPRTVVLYLYTADLEPVKRSGFNQTAWKSALRAAGIEDSRQKRHARPTAHLRLGAAGRRREHQGPRGLPRPRRPRLHAADLHPPAAGERGPHPAGN